MCLGCRSMIYVSDVQKAAAAFAFDLKENAMEDGLSYSPRKVRCQALAHMSERPCQEPRWSVWRPGSNPKLAAALGIVCWMPPALWRSHKSTCAQVLSRMTWAKRVKAVHRGSSSHSRALGIGAESARGDKGERFR